MQQGRSRTIITGVTATICMLAVATIVANLNFIPITSDTNSAAYYISGLSAFIFPTTLALWFIVLAGAVLQRTRRVPFGKRAIGNDRASIIGLALVLSAVIIASVFFQTGVIDLKDPSDPIPWADPGERPAEGGSTSESASTFDPLSLVPLIVILALVSWLSYRRFKVERDGVELPPGRLPEEATVIEEAISTIGSGDDVRGSIIEAYHQMCRLVGGPRSAHSALTPRELESDLVHRLRWPQDPVHRLTMVFEEARYSEHPLDEGDRGAALTSLDDLRTSLGRNNAG